MRVIAYKKIAEFTAVHSDAKISLDDWYARVEDAEWGCFVDIRLAFNSVDSVGNKRYVFNVKGNTYRLIALVLFEAKVVYIRGIYTHADYDKIKDCSKV